MIHQKTGFVIGLIFFLSMFWLVSCASVIDSSNSSKSSSNNSSAGSSSSNSTISNNVWYVIGTPGAVGFIGTYTNGLTNIGGNPYPSLEYMKSNNVISLHGTLHLINGPSQPGKTKICVLPPECSPSVKAQFGYTCINNGSNVTSVADLSGEMGTVDTDGSVWISSPNEDITDLYINDSGGPAQWLL
jgi:hypothetical protein